MSVRYAIDSRVDPHTDRHVFTVWELPSEGEPIMLGEYDSVESAKRSLSVEWRPPNAEAKEGTLFDAENFVAERQEVEDYPTT